MWNTFAIQVINQDPTPLSFMVVIEQEHSNPNRYTVIRKGPETKNKWTVTAEDPNAYDRPENVVYLSKNKTDIWGFKEHSIEEVNTEIATLVAQISSPGGSVIENSKQKGWEFLNVAAASPTGLQGEEWTYTYDKNGNVETILNRMGNRVYGYDPINRLTRDEKQTVINPTTKSYGYDRNGNRDTFIDGRTTYNNSYQQNSNRITNDAVGAVTQDLTGNQKSDRGGSRTFDYNEAGRLFQVKESGVVVATYYYNAFGQRTRKVTSQGTTIYHYDLGGNLISETTGTGAAIRDYVLLGNMPVAQIDNNGATESIAYLHTDHLGSPRSATNEAGNVIWGWNRNEKKGSSRLLHIIS